MHVSRLALGLAFPLIVVACGGVDGTTGAPAASNDGDGNGSGGDTTTSDGGAKRDGGHADAGKGSGGSGGGTGGSTPSACDTLFDCCTELSTSDAADCNSTASAGDATSCDGALASYVKRGLCSDVGGSGGTGGTGGTGGSGGSGGTGGFDAGSGTGGSGGGTVATCADLLACCAASSDPSTCELLASLGDDATCASLGASYCP
ncbi:MAG TPA: hypothetical protein VF407_15715 [Polyangiaceae bacterium]